MLASVAARMPGPFVDGSRVDVRRFGLAHGLVALAFFAVGIARRIRAPRLVVIALAIAAPDVFLPWNGLHPDVAATFGLVGIVVGGLDGRDDRVGRGLAAASVIAGSVLVGFSSRSHAFVPMLVALALLLAARPRRAPTAYVLPIAVLAIGVLAIVHFELGSGPRFDAINRYHAIYRGVAEVASDRTEVLREFGLGAESEHLVGRSRFEVEPGPEVESALSRSSRVELAVSYLRRPAAIVRTARRVLGALSDPRPPLGGTYGRTSPARAPRMAARGVDLRALRTELGSLGVLAVLVGVAVALIAPHGRSSRGRPLDATFFVFALSLVAVEPVVAVLGDGTFSLRRHLLLSSVTLDVALGVVVLSAAEALLRGRRPNAAVPAPIASE